MTKTQESFMFTVGKLDAGMAILLGERAHLIEFPSLLLPPGATTGSIVNISVQQNHAEEKKRDTEFWNLQNDILAEYGTNIPESPNLELRNVTQTSVTLEWPPLQLATAKLRSLDIYRNRQRLAAIPSPSTNTSTKLSGLQLDTEYTFQLILRTTAGTFPSNVLHVRTHTMTDTSGICVCFGTVQDSVLLENAKMALRDMGAKWSDKIQIDTTHFVCTTPATTPAGADATGSLANAPGVEYQKALQMSIPVVQPTWVLACHSERKMMPIHPYYLGASPIAAHSASYGRPQSMSQASVGSPTNRTSSPNTPRSANRQSMPPPARSAASPPVATKSPSAAVHHIEPTPEEPPEEQGESVKSPTNKHTRTGTMSKDFRFPPQTPGKDVPPPVPDLPPVPRGSNERPPQHVSSDTEEVSLTPLPVIQTSVEVPPPPPVDKERSPVGADMDEDVGETEEISLN
ncbi:hypothetical protein BDY19DRAFT_889851 [Irpex rosettiformis]|uniref:Uncharacterized protein n=1 Tax=Irpex rosettiformis TaxID=378272 RepID=A0ACB8U554_9APHY|nr:hypothetical protein BDY19DRAFT_889851 [Irpex rosettiformis]